MLYFRTVILTLFFFSVSIAETESYDNLFHKNLGKYFSVHPLVIKNLHDSKITNEELPVVLKISKLSSVTPDKIASSRLKGYSWSKIINIFGINKRELYYTIEGNFYSSTYSPIIEQFRQSPIDHYEKIILSDEDIINLINLKFIGSHHDYSLFKIMDLRDMGHDFTSINKVVFELRRKQIKEDKAKRIALIKARNKTDQKIENPHNFSD